MVNNSKSSSPRRLGEIALPFHSLLDSILNWTRKKERKGKRKKWGLKISLVLVVGGMVHLLARAPRFFRCLLLSRRVLLIDDKEEEEEEAQCTAVAQDVGDASSSSISSLQRRLIIKSLSELPRRVAKKKKEVLLRAAPVSYGICVVVFHFGSKILGRSKEILRYRVPLD